MRIAVCLKQVPDPEFPFQASSEGIDLDAPGLSHLANPLDLVACEAAIQLKEAAGGTVTLLTVGPVAAESALRTGAALGADAAVRVDVDAAGPLAGDTTARLLAGALANDPPDVVLCGARSSDSGSGAVPVALAERLGWPLVANAVSLRLDGALELERRVDGGRRQVVQVEPPVVITVEESLCQPRYPSVLARHKADRMAIAVTNASQLGIELPASSITLSRLQGPRPLASRLVAPPEELPARARLQFILAGGPDQKRTSKRLEGPVPAIVEQLLEYLAANGVSRVGGRA